MKKLFYIGVLCIVVFEILNGYLIMPMPGSQHMNSLPYAYFLYHNRWLIRILFYSLIFIGLKHVFRSKRKWFPVTLLLIAAIITYAFNYKIMAEKIFLPMHSKTFSTKSNCKLSMNAIAIVVTNNNEAKAFPVRYILYHHQVRDTVGGKSLMITYCSVCRTGRVYEPIVNGKEETFRLVGMDHFNAMFEDRETKSWWRQENGECVAGEMKGKFLHEYFSEQMTLQEFFNRYPNGQVLNADTLYNDEYDVTGNFELGKSKSELTGTDTASWHDKSWVVGIVVNTTSKAYDWNELKKKRCLNDVVDHTPVVITLASDNQSFFVYQKTTESNCSLSEDTLQCGDQIFSLDGHCISDSTVQLQSINAYQEFWHSWKYFHPETLK